MGTPQGTHHAYWVSRAYGRASWESRKDTPDSAEHGSTSWGGSIPLGEAVRSLGRPHGRPVFPWSMGAPHG